MQRFIGVNRYQDVLWFNQESFEQLLWWLFASSVIDLTARQAAIPAAEDEQTSLVAQSIVEHYDLIKRLQKAEHESHYQVEKLLEAANTA